MTQTNKRVAILILCHTNPEQINDMIRCLDDEIFDFFLHIDPKSGIRSQIRQRDHVYFVPEEQLTDVRWGHYSMVEATLTLINLAMESNGYDYFWFCSGQDFPIRSIREIRAFFREKDCDFLTFSSSRNYPINGIRNTKMDKRCEIVYPDWMIGRQFWQRGLKKLYQLATGGSGHTFSIFRRRITCGFKLYFGSQWWCLRRETIEWIIAYLRGHSEICLFFKTTLCPDECMIQTLMMNCPGTKKIEPNLVYIDWTTGKSSPKILNLSDYESMIASEKLMARKIDSKREPELYRRLLERAEETF